MNNMILNPTKLPSQTLAQIPLLPKFTQMFRSDLFRSNVFYIKDEFDYKTLDKSKEIN
jgi:hypothetical protein